MLRRIRLLHFILVLALAVPLMSAPISVDAASAAVEVDITSTYWDTPEIPIKPDAVTNVANPVINLNDHAGSGIWKFAFTPATNVPAWTASNQDYDFSAWSSSGWQNVIVPGELSMQGFAITMNKEYYYQRQVDLPADYASNRVMLRFEGAYSNARVWVDGRFVRTHIGGFTAWDCDITDFVTAGQAFTLTVGINDSSSNPSDGSGYAHHNMGGILRDVTLFALPEDYIKHLYVDTTFDSAFIDANLEITAQLGMVSATAELEIELYDKAGALVLTDSIDFTKGSATGSDSTVAKRITIPVAAPLKWDAEHPNLYTLKTSVSVNGSVKEVASQKIGFREVTYGGANGTDSNKVYVNGKEIKLRGTCRHDVSFELGRSLTKELAYHEIKSFKEANINFIRTSHYPVSHDILDACDEYGVYVEHETAVCWTGSSPVAVYLDQFTEMVEKDRNHPSTIIWSLGNESDFESSGANQSFRRQFNYIKDIDLSRPTIFSYPSTVRTSPQPWDIYSSHYPGYGGSLGNSQYPVLHDEYAHIPCYDLGEIKLDPNVRNFWGESIKIFWERMFTTDGCLGGALWGGIDDVFYLPNGSTGYGEWGSVLDVAGRLKPEAYLTKKAYSPVRLDPEDYNIVGDSLVFPVKNWFDHTDFNELAVKYNYDGGAVNTMTPASVLPHSAGTLTIPGYFTAADKLSLKFYQGEWLIDEYIVDLKPAKCAFTPPSAIPPVITQDSDSITVSGTNFSVVFDKATAKISTAEYKGKEVITGGPDLHGTTGTEAVAAELISDWAPAASNPITAEIVDNMAVVTIRGSYGTRVQSVTFKVSISSNGIITTDYTVGTMPTSYTNLQEAGIQFDIAGGVEKVSWLRDGLYDTYPDNHIGRNEGTAMKVRPGYALTPDTYRVRPAWDWKDDLANYFNYREDDPNNSAATNDFKSMREYVRYYDVHYTGTDVKISVESDAKVAARVESRKIDTGREVIDDRDPRIVYTGGWATYGDSGDYNGTETYSTTNGASAELSFHGTGIRFIGTNQSNTGRLEVYLDDYTTPIAEINTYNSGGKLYQQVVFSKTDLPEGEHKIKIVTVAAAGLPTCIVVDAFEVLNSVSQILEPTKLIINNGWGYPFLGWGNYTGGRGRLQTGTTGSVTIRLSDTENFYKVSIPSASNVAITRAGNVLTLSYDEVNATANSVFDVSWWLLKIGNDEYFAEALTAVGDSYTIPSEQFGSMIYCYVTPSETVPGGSLEGKAVKSNEIIFGEGMYDFYDVQAPPLPGFTISSTGYIYDYERAWTQNAYNKSVLYLTSANAYCSFTFTGDMIRFIGQRENNMGYANVTIDNGPPEQISFYRAVSNSETVSEVLFEKRFDVVGTHTITVTCTGTRPTGSSANNNALDAFIVFDSSKANGYVQNVVVTDDNNVLAVDFDIFLADKADCTYEWYRKDAFSSNAYELIAGANDPYYKTSVKDTGKQFICKVTPHANGEAGLSGTSSNIVVARVLLVDDTEPSITYPPGRIADTGSTYSALYKSTISWFTNGEVVYNFTGTGIVWYGMQDSNGADYADITIDGDTQRVNMDKSGWSATTRVLYAVTDLEPGSHTIKIRPGTGGNGYCGLDLLMVYLSSEEEIKFTSGGEEASVVVPGTTLDVFAALNPSDANQQMLAALYSNNGKLISVATAEGVKYSNLLVYEPSIDIPDNIGPGAYVKLLIWDSDYVPLRAAIEFPG